MTEHEIIGWHQQLNGMSLSKLWEMVKDREAWHAAVYGVTKSWRRLNNRTTKRSQYFLSGHLSKVLIP